MTPAVQFNKGASWKILDRGYVTYINSMGDDEEIVEAARMSTGRGFISWEPYFRCRKCDKTWTFDAPIACGTELGANNHDPQPFPKGDLGFLEFLYMNRHMTPFEMPELCIEVKAPIFVFREWHRHRTQSYNEFSARYAQMPNEHYIPSLERMLRSLQSKANKQGSEDGLDEHVAHVEMQNFADEQEAIYEAYDARIKKGVSNEISRINTPVSRYSKMRAKTDLRNWLGFLLLRKQSAHSKPQWEISQYADAVGFIIQSLYPRTYALFEEHTLYAETFSRTEMRAIREMMRQLGNSKDSVRVDLEAYGLYAGLDATKAKALVRKLTTA